MPNVCKFVSSHLVLIDSVLSKPREWAQADVRGVCTTRILSTIAGRSQADA